jgi:hypothetical protein
VEALRRAVTAERASAEEAAARAAKSERAAEQAKVCPGLGGRVVIVAWVGHGRWCMHHR